MPTGKDIEAGRIIQASRSTWGSTQPGTHIVGIQTDRYTLLVLLPHNTDLPRAGTTVWVSRSLTAARIVIGMQTLRVSLAYTGIKPSGLLTGWWDTLQRISYLTLARLAREGGMRDTALELSLKANRNISVELPGILPALQNQGTAGPQAAQHGLDADATYVLQQLHKMRQGLRYAHDVHSLAHRSKRKTPRPARRAPGLIAPPPRAESGDATSERSSDRPSDRH